MLEKSDPDIIKFLSEPKNVKTAFHVHAAFPEVLRNLRVRFWRSTEALLQKALTEFPDWTCDFSDKRADVILLSPKRSGSKTYCCIGIGDGNGGGGGYYLYYGVMLPVGPPRKKMSELAGLEKLLEESGLDTKEATWVRLKNFADVDLNDADVLAKISKGDSAIQESLTSCVTELLRDLGTKVLDADKAMAAQRE